MILGGAQENTLLTVRGLHENSDYEVTLVTGPALGPEGELIEAARKFGVEPVILDELRREIKPWADLKSLFKLYSHFKNNNYDLVHTHSSKAGILGRWAALMARVPLIVHTIHGLPFHKYQSKPEYWLYSRLEKYTSYFTDKIITVCDRMAEKAQAVGVAPKSGFQTVYSGMELEEFLEVPPPDSKQAQKLRKEWGYSKEEFVIGKIARLFHLKGHKYCLPAFQKVAEKKPEARLLLVGDGILRDKLEKQAAELGIREKVQFAGLVPYRQIPEMLTVMDCLVHTSLREGLPRVIPQAQAAGRPAVSYAIDGAPEAIDDGETGFLVPPKSIDKLAESLLTLANNQELREQFAEAAKDWVVPRYRWQYMAKKTISCYNRLFEE